MKLTDDQRTILDALREYGEGGWHCSAHALTDYLNHTRPRSWDWTYAQVASSLARMEKRGLVVKSRLGWRR